ncbi:unnamed protein product [Brachionus calyciflorus]|uniref:MULE transposase domain-containing protein n=1 Tax=Brachionus calyciflorus TaxID=104777 RepID=A0A813WZ81_9BILA|nr:unnamed protein product [Brachionus calyciflorus]
MNSQHRHRYQLAHDLRIDSDASKNIFDNLLPGCGRRSIKGFIQEIHSNPYAALRFCEYQVKMWELVRELNPIWFFDTTGNIMARLKNQKEILIYSIVVHDDVNKTSFPIADFFSSENDSITINSFLTKIVERFSLYSFFKKPKVVVTDYSWANIHAISRAFNNLEVIDYLNLTFKVLVEGKLYSLTPINTFVYLCSTHFLKNKIDETDRVLKKKDSNETLLVRKRFIKSFILLQNCETLESFCKLLLCIRNIFMNEEMNENYLKSIAYLTAAQKEIDFLKKTKFPNKSYINDNDEIKKYAYKHPFRTKSNYYETGYDFFQFENDEVQKSAIQYKISDLNMFNFFEDDNEEENKIVLHKIINSNDVEQKQTPCTTDDCCSD